MPIESRDEWLAAVRRRHERQVPAPRRPSVRGTYWRPMSAPAAQWPTQLGLSAFGRGPSSATSLTYGRDLVLPPNSWATRDWRLDGSSSRAWSQRRP